MIHTHETQDHTGTVIEAVEYDTDTQMVTTTANGETTERPMTAEELQHYLGLETFTVATTNTTQLVQESAESVDKLVLVVENLNLITDMSNAEINANPAAIIKDVARELKTVARQANREARLTSGSTDDTFTGTDDGT